MRNDDVRELQKKERNKKNQPMKRGLRDLGNIRSIFSSTSIRNVFSL
jgi:hypothetical protein